MYILYAKLNPPDEHHDEHAISCNYNCNAVHSRSHRPPHAHHVHLAPCSRYTRMHQLRPLIIRQTRPYYLEGCGRKSIRRRMQCRWMQSVFSMHWHWRWRRPAEDVRLDRRLLLLARVGRYGCFIGCATDSGAKDRLARAEGRTAMPLPLPLPLPLPQPLPPAAVAAAAACRLPHVAAAKPPSRLPSRLPSRPPSLPSRRREAVKPPSRQAAKPPSQAAKDQGVKTRRSKARRQDGGTWP